MKQYEIEIKLFVKNLKQLIQDLKTLGFQKEVLKREEDVYFYSRHYDIKKRDEALRIRKSTNLMTNQIKTQLNFKGPKLDKISMSRKELEIEIENASIMEEILQNLDFGKAAFVCKTRQYMRRNDITACIDQVENLGNFLELEILAESKDQKEKSLKRIEGILENLGYSMEDTTQTSYLSMLMNQEK